MKMEPPASISNLQVWWATLPGDSLFGFRFQIKPGDFVKLLGGRHFDVVPHELIPSEVEYKVQNLSSLGMPQPLAPLTVAFQYSVDGPPPGLPHIVEIFANDDRSQIVVYGDN